MSQTTQNPELFSATLKAAFTLHQQGRLDHAQGIYQEMLQEQPTHFDALRLLATIYGQQKNPTQALALFDRALAINPHHASTLNNRGNALFELKLFDQALTSYDKALQVKPDYIDALNHKTNTLRILGRYDDALACCAQVLQMSPQHAGGFINRGAVMQELRRFDDALRDWQQALKIEPGNAQAHFSSSLCLLLLGHFEQGWAQYEWRFQDETANIQTPPFHQPRWTGQENLQGKTILLHNEQGLGDTIQFCRYAAQVAQRGAKVILGVPSALKNVVASIAGASSIVTEQDILPPFDYHCPLLSLPLAFKTQLDDISGQAYLYSDPNKVAQWKKELVGNKKKIGLVFSGNLDHKNDHNRSIALQKFKALVHDWAHYYCLQKELKPADQATLDTLKNLTFLGDKLNDFSDTAAIIEQLDLVITVDTSVAHLAGALGKPVWILLPFVPDWRWMLERTDSPWYNSARLFRQAQKGDWSGVLTQVNDALTKEFL